MKCLLVLVAVAVAVSAVPDTDIKTEHAPVLKDDTLRVVQPIHPEVKDKILTKRDLLYTAPAFKIGAYPYSYEPYSYLRGYPYYYGHDYLRTHPFYYV